MDAESRWLLRGIGYAFLVDCAVLGVLAIAFGWQADKVGNGLQLLGLMFAALGVPVVSPWLASVELGAAAARDATARWVHARLRQLQGAWTRLRRRRPRTVAMNVEAHSSATASASATLTTGYGVSGARELAIRALDEIKQLRKDLSTLETTSRQETEQKLDALRTELQLHVSSITREGWHYIIGGAGITALGIVVALFA
jgi:hypothetical protein